MSDDDDEFYDDYIDELHSKIDTLMQYARHHDGCVRRAGQGCSCGFAQVLVQLDVYQPTVDVKVAGDRL